jgi:NADH-quinone oxidoreductase subunit H
LDGIIESITQFQAQEPAIFALIIGIVGAAIISAVVNVGACDLGRKKGSERFLQ